MHPHTARFSVPVSGVRDGAPYGPKADEDRRLIGYTRRGAPIYGIAGGAPAEPPDVLADVERIAELSDDELGDLEARLVTEAEAVAETDSDEAIAQLSAIRDAVAVVRTEQATRETARAERESRRAELLGEIAPVEEVDDDAEGEDAEGEQAEPEEAPAEVPAVEEVPEPAGEPVAVAAAVEPAPAPTPTPMPRAPRARQRSVRPAEPEVRLSLVAAGDVPGFSAGQAIPGLDALGQATADKAQAALKSGPGFFPVASIHTQMPRERDLRGLSASEATERINNVISPEAIVAAGGLCAPVTPKYDLAGIATVSRPIRDSLPGFGADRGGVRFIRPPVLADLAAAVNTFTEDQDTSSSAYPKPCLTVTCGADTEVLVQAVYMCLTVGNWNYRFFIEQWNRFWQLAQAMHAREAEQNLIAGIEASATDVTTGQIAGAARDILENLDQASAQYRNRHRTLDDLVLNWLAPSWLLNYMRADLTRQMPGDDVLGITTQQINGYLTARGIRPVWSPDYQVFGAQGAGTLLPWETGLIRSVLYHEGAYIFLDGGELDFGMEMRDSTLNAQNQLQAAMESFENVAFTGIEAIELRMDLCADGSAAALETLVACVSGS